MTKKPDITEKEEIVATPEIKESSELSEHGYNDSIIRKLGIVGWEPVEDMILAAMLTGDSIMLYGPKGEAKTEVARRIAMALDVEFREIDASKVNFEDLGGFPNIIGQSQDPDAPPFISTPLNIWNVPFLFIDEFARATPHIQNKLMEIIRSRRFMGYPTGAKWVFSAMNPLSDEYVGNNPVDIAAASRFSWVILSPISSSMSLKDLQTVANTRSFDDASALKFWTGTESITYKHLPDTFSEGQEDLKRLLKQAGGLYEGLSETTRYAVPKYVAEVIKLLKANDNYDVDGRRASTLNRAILSMYCIKLARAGEIDKAISLELLESAALLALNNALATVDLITGSDKDSILSPTKLSRAHDSSKATLATGEAAITYKLITTDDPVEAIDLIINNTSDQITVLSTISKILQSYPVLSTILASLPSCAEIPGMARSVIVKTAALIHNTGHRLLQYPNHAIHPFIGYGDTGMSSHRRAYMTLQEVLLSADSNDPISITTMKAAFMAALETTARTLSIPVKKNNIIYDKLSEKHIGLSLQIKDYTYPNWSKNIHLRESLDYMEECNEKSKWIYMFIACDTCLPALHGGIKNMIVENISEYTKRSEKTTSLNAIPIKTIMAFEFDDIIEEIGGITYQYTIQSGHNVKTVTNLDMLEGIAIPGVTDSKFILKTIQEDGIITDSDDTQISNTLLFLANVTHSLYKKYMTVMEAASGVAMEYLNDRGQKDKETKTTVSISN